MGTALETRAPIDEAPVRTPGDFARHPHTGAPYVTDPTRTSRPKGTKAELLAMCETHGVEVPDTMPTTGKRPTNADLIRLLEAAGVGPAALVQYGRPSGFGKQIENATNLQKWAERMVALGVARGVVDLVIDPAAVADVDPESREGKDILDRVARHAKTLAKADLAAERGTHHHELTEDDDEGRDFVARIAAGEALAVPRPVQTGVVEVWRLALAASGVEICEVEAKCVDDRWRLAGTLDRVARLTRDLHFVTVHGERVTLKAGTVLILDIKTGRLRLERGRPIYWHGYAVQLASYAQSVPYDPDTGERGEWSEPIDQRYAIIAHLDVLAALDGNAICRFILVDLEAGREAGDLVCQAKAWEKRRDVFSIVDDTNKTTELFWSVPVDIPEPVSTAPEVPQCQPASTPAASIPPITGSTPETHSSASLTEPSSPSTPTPPNPSPSPSTPPNAPAPASLTPSIPSASIQSADTSPAPGGSSVAPAPIVIPDLAPSVPPPPSVPPSSTPSATTVGTSTPMGQTAATLTEAATEAATVSVPPLTTVTPLIGTNPPTASNPPESIGSTVSTPEMIAPTSAPSNGGQASPQSVPPSSPNAPTDAAPPAASAGTPGNITDAFPGASLVDEPHDLDALAVDMLTWPDTVRLAMAGCWPGNLPNPGQVRRGEAHWTEADLPLLRQIFTIAEAPFNIWTEPPAEPGEYRPAMSSMPLHDGAEPCERTNLDALAADVRADPEILAVFNRWLAEGHAGGRAWSPIKAPNVRCFEIGRAALRLAQAMGGDADDEVRALIGEAVPTVRHATAVDPVGAILGALSSQEAQAVSEAADAFVAGRYTLTYSPDGRPELTAA